MTIEEGFLVIASKMWPLKLLLPMVAVVSVLVGMVYHRGIIYEYITGEPYGEQRKFRSTYQYGGTDCGKCRSISEESTTTTGVQEFVLRPEDQRKQPQQVHLIVEFNYLSETITGKITCETGLSKLFERVQSIPKFISFRLRLAKNRKYSSRTKWIPSDLMTFILRFTLNVADFDVHCGGNCELRVRLYGKNKSWRTSKLYGQGSVALKDVFVSNNEVDLPTVITPVVGAKKYHVSRFVSSSSLHKLI